MTELDEKALEAAMIEYYRLGDRRHGTSTDAVRGAIAAYLAVCEPGPVVTPTRDQLAQTIRDWFEDGRLHYPDRWKHLADCVLGLLRSRPAPATPQPFEVTDADVFDACMTWRHDFGLLAPDDDESTQLVYEMRKILMRYALRIAKRPQPAQPAVARTVPLEIWHGSQLVQNVVIDVFETQFTPAIGGGGGRFHIKLPAQPAEGVVDVDAFAKALWLELPLADADGKGPSVHEVKRSLLAVGLDKRGFINNDNEHCLEVLELTTERDKLRAELERLKQPAEGVVGPFNFELKGGAITVTADRPLHSVDLSNIAGGAARANDLHDELVAMRVDRDKLAAQLNEAREALAEAEKSVARQTDWYQQRFNRLRTWVKEEVEPLSKDVAHRYFGICANGSPAPHESADWRETMHGLTLRAEAAEAKCRELEADRDNWRDQYRDGAKTLRERLRESNHRAADLQGRLESAEAELDEFHCAHCGLSCAPERTAYSLRGRLDTLRSNVAELAEMFDGRKDGPWSPDAARRLRAALAATAEQKPAEPVKCDYADKCPGHAQASERPCEYEPVTAADPVPAAHEALVARLDRHEQALRILAWSNGQAHCAARAELDKSDAPPASDVLPSKP
jgi:hypothetical protein